MSRMEKFIGCMVSLNCGETLGTYQGQVIAINPVEGTITIIKPYRNGIPFKSPQVTLRSQDIQHLAIVKSSDETKELPRSKKNNSDSLLADRVKSSSAKSNAISQTSTLGLEMNSFDPQKGNLSAAFPKSKHTASRTLQNGAYRETATDGLDKIKVNGGSRFAVQNFSNGHDSNSQMTSLASANFSQLFVTSADNKTLGQKRAGSASEISCIQQNRRTTTPRKADRQQQKNFDCFTDSEILLDDFDFEKNLSLFDKQAVFEEIEKGNENHACAQNSRMMKCSEQKYRCNENILQGAKATYRQIKLLGRSSKKDAPGREFVTDSGLLVPSIPLELRERLLSLAENYGFSCARMLEMAGRSASEMILQLLGGNSRFDPRNLHQLPRVVVLCGAGRQAAVAVNCARHLATHSVAVVLFLSPSFHLSNEANTELELYQLTGGKSTSALDELPSAAAVDLIVSALFPHDSDSDSWSQTVSHWANENKARVLSIDPLIEGSSIESSWCLTWALPLSYDEKCGQVYLCDLGIPQNLFKEVGIAYESPFAHKFVMPLHRS